MKRIISVSAIISLALITAILAAGYNSGGTATPGSKGDALLAQGENEFWNNNLNTAAELFTLAQENYTTTGDDAAALRPRDRTMTAALMG